MRKRSLAFRLSFLILTGSALVLAVIVGYDYRFARHIIVANAEQNARGLAVATVNRVEAVLRATQKVPEGLADFLEHTTYTRDQLLEFIRTAVEKNPEVSGMTVAFEPYAFDPQARYFAPYFHRRNDRIEFAYVGGDSYRYFYMDWYQLPKELGRPAWTAPYYDKGAGNVITSSYAVPLYRNVDAERRFVGVVEVDISLAWLERIVSSTRILKTGYAFLISNNGTVVTHPESNLVMNETIFSIAEGRNDARLREIGRDMVQGKSGSLAANCITSDKPCWLVYEAVPANGWSLGVVIPQAELMADVVRLSRNVLVLGTAGSLLLMLLVIPIAHSITRPLGALARASEEIARGNLDTALPPVSSRDEVGQLSATFERMQRDLKRYIVDLQETSAARERAAAQLEEYSRTLEHKVAERTRDLREKNEELETTLVQLKQTQQQLVIQEKLASLGALTAGIAHEIKNPLNFVTNFALLSTELVQELRQELAAQREQLDARAVEYIGELLSDLEQNVAKITEHGKRADSIVRGMLQHSRGKSGERRPNDLNALLAEYVGLAYHGMRAQDPSFNIKLETSYDPAVGIMNVVPQDLSRAFLNVVNNACYAAHQRTAEVGDGFTPTVSVRTKDLGDRVEIRIRDNGNGIPPAVREKIFHPFFTTKPTGQGTGLGLSITHDIVVQQHKGELRVESEEGRFAEFVIVLPKGAA